MATQKLITFGKEYELNTYLNFKETKSKSNDGSGPSEIKTPPFKSVKNAIFFEYILRCIYGHGIFDYYYCSNGCEEKGNHFHFRISNVDKRLDYNFLYEFYYISAPLFLLVRKLFTLHSRFRNTVTKWCKYFVNIVNSPNDVKSHTGREYAFMTFNRNHKNTLTIEVRVSEGSIITDLCALALALGTYLVLRNEVKIDVHKWRSYCLWVDKFKVVVDGFCNECTCEDESENEYPRLHTYLLYEYPTELSLPVPPPQDSVINIIADLETLIPFEYDKLDDNIKRAIVKDSSFKYIIPVARKGLERYGHEFENIKEFVELLKIFEREYVNANRSRHEFVNIVYNYVREEMKEKFNKFVYKVAKWIVEE